jgi:hypothetical protein
MRLKRLPALSKRAMHRLGTDSGRIGTLNNLNKPVLVIRYQFYALPQTGEQVRADIQPGAPKVRDKGRGRVRMLDLTRAFAAFGPL